MKFRNTLLLILVFVGLGLYLILVEVPDKEKKDEEAIRAKRALHFKVEDVQAFDLIKPSETIKVRRNSGNFSWEISEPLAVPGEDGVINQLLLSLEEARITRVVEEDPKDLAGYGLQDPALSISLHFKSGDPVTLRVGGSSPIGHNTYIKRDDEKRVLMSFIDTRQLNASVNDLRSKILLDFVERDVTAVDLKYEKDVQRLVKEGETWKLAAPVTALGDADEISNFLNGVRMERIETFVSETPDHLESLGLSPPRIVLNIHAEKAKQEWTLKIGKAFDEHSYYALRSRPQNVVTVSDSLVETLSKNPLNFMEKSLLAFQENEVAEIEVGLGKEAVRVKRDTGKAGRWTFSDPEEGPGDSATVNTLLLDLKEARIEEFAPVQNLKLFGLESPRKTLTVVKNDGSRETLGLGNPDTDKSHYFATRSADRTVFQLKAETVNKLFRPRKDFRDKKLLKFDPEQVARISMVYPGQTFELRRRNRQWVLVQPKEISDLKPFIGKDILWTLNNLEYEKKDVPSPTNDTGLDHPRLTVLLMDQENRTLGKLKIGSQVKDQPFLYSMLEGDSALYQIKDRTLGEIPDRLDRFQKQGE